LIDRFTKPSGVSDDERLKRTATIIQRAVKNGLTEVEVWRFLRAQGEPAFLEYHQHLGVVRQDLRDQFAEPSSPRDRRQMAHQRRTDTLPLNSATTAKNL
jgi:hypothetical protein